MIILNYRKKYQIAKNIIKHKKERIIIEICESFYFYGRSQIP